MKIKEIRWIKKVGYQIVERELGKGFEKGIGTRDYELFCFERQGDNYQLIKESRKLEVYNGLSNDYESDLKIFHSSNKQVLTASQYEALKYVAENKTDEWSKSPYSLSFYSSKNIGWGYKPEGSLRVSDHWNFGVDGEHCPTAEPVEGWAVCRFENGVYHLIKKF